MKRPSFASLVRRAMVPITAALALAACAGRDPASPASAVTPLVQSGNLELQASFQVPPGRGAGDTLVVVVTMRNAGTAPLQVHTSPCPVSVRLLAAAPGDRASATFYDDFQRPCARMLVVIPLAPGETHRFEHGVPMDRISPAAPREVQAHVGVLVGSESGTGIVLLTGGRFTLP